MILRLTDVSKAFGGLRALDGVTFEVEPRTVHAVIGPNGAGKTTLFSVISGEQRPDSGRIEFDGQDVTARPTHLRARAGLVRTFQLTRPFAALSVLDNVAVAAGAHLRTRKEAVAAATEAIERVGLGAYLERPAGELPAAARKQLELARALALRPKVLLLDEVLAGLTASEREPLVTLLADLRAEGMTLVLVEHVMPAVMRLADRVLVLERGSVLAEGEPAAIARDPRVIAAYLGENSDDALA
ncbi:ABC transporter ATP-binding protein [Nonomuraea sp. MCN248]|uniref:ABC transporter ATP-binding protein n=1 Tax=Nonomuraea corallina TaxID=2989783 RepID=A0ABT4S8X7_9ACTN|nr:ABC transporter ATP-binding protein [Nonomuraea corallina]MDA0633668.1 ABC transporter ATP-binding protein [Nonomuraea corallina]